MVTTSRLAVITNHGTPIADLVAHGAGTSPLRHMKRPGPLPKLIQLEGEGQTASEVVLADRVA
jgi:antitoxin (DNA-binding transcriptional repressor) of toxin-antitoxin stability system